MKRTIAVGTGLILLAALAFQLGFRGGPLTAPPPWSGPAPDRSAVPQALSLHVLPAGRMLTRAGLSFRGGSFAEERVFGMDVLLIRHPRGDLLIDAGFGRDIDAHFLTTPLSMQLSARYESERPVADQLQAAGLDPASLSGVLLTHAPWDHVSGLADLSGVPVWVSEAELAFARSDDEATRLARQIGLEHWRGFDFPDGPHLGFERSRDWFGDGSVVVVPAAGHTPGSVIVFVHRRGGQSLALIGDTAWQREGVEWPVDRPWPIRRLIGEDDEAVRRQLRQLHALGAAMPLLRMLPSHDRRQWQGIPALR